MELRGTLPRIFAVIKQPARSLPSVSGALINGQMDGVLGYTFPAQLIPRDL